MSATAWCDRAEPLQVGLHGQNPRVSIGLPVFNGANYVGQALDSILRQTFEDFELIISDNASTDDTPAICQSYAARDRRIRYVRSDRNRGASPNWNHTFELASGDYFKWAAHDDVLHPEYLARTVAVMDAKPEVVLCQSLVEQIDAAGHPLSIYDSSLTGAGSPAAADRFATLVLQSHTCTELYGLIRRAALRRTRLHGAYHGGDRALLAELALCGRFVQIREPLLQVRDHPGRYTRSVAGSHEQLAWHDARRTGRPGIPSLRLYANYVAAVRRHLVDSGQRWRCFGHLLRWWTHNWNAARVAVDLVAVFVPGAWKTAEQVKWRVFGIPPGLRRLEAESELTIERSQLASR